MCRSDGCIVHFIVPAGHGLVKGGGLPADQRPKGADGQGVLYARKLPVRPLEAHHAQQKQRCRRSGPGPGRRAANLSGSVSFQRPTGQIHDQRRGQQYIVVILQYLRPAVSQIVAGVQGRRELAAVQADENTCRQQRITEGKPAPHQPLPENQHRCQPQGRQRRREVSAHERHAEIKGFQNGLDGAHAPGKGLSPHGVARGGHAVDKGRQHEKEAGQLAQAALFLLPEGEEQQQRVQRAAEQRRDEIAAAHRRA